MTVPPPGPAEPVRTLHEWAAVAGHYRWVEMRLFETLGRWVPTVPEPEVKLRLRAHSFHHAWHAELWLGLVPVVPGVSADEVAVPMGGPLAALADAVAEPMAPDRTIEKLVGVYRVLLPRLVVAYSAEMEAHGDGAGTPVARPLHLILRDEVDDWHEGEVLVQGLLRTPDDVERAARHQRRLEALVLEAGGAEAGGDASLTGPPEG